MLKTLKYVSTYCDCCVWQNKITSFSFLLKLALSRFNYERHTPGSDFPPPNNPKFDKIKKLKFSYNRDLSFLILSNFGLLGGRKSESGVSGTNLNEIKLPLRIETR